MYLDPDRPDAALDDCYLSADALDRAVALDGRWPEPRLLQQTDVWISRDRTVWRLSDLTPEGLRELLDGILRLADAFHGQASVDENHQTSTLLEEVYDELGICMVAAISPRVWIESTELVRWLRRRA